MSGITEWKGRYARIAGGKSVFHVQNHHGRWHTVIIWDRQDDGIGTCIAVDSPIIDKLTRVVNAVKQRISSREGGSFQINEFGQVLVPTSDNSRQVWLIGEIRKPLVFYNPFDGNSTFDLGDSSGMKCGAPWPWPYIGIPHHLSKGSKIYFYRTDDEGGRREYPPVQDRYLVQALRMIRPYGAMKFVVNYAGVVLTKRPPKDWTTREHEDWEPVFVGRINPECWFRKEFMSKTFHRFEGNCPHNVAKDAKYRVRSGENGKLVVSLTYRTLDGERWHATTEEHGELVEMVNDAKNSFGVPPNGSFYINEYKQVIVPSVASRDYLLAGKYEGPLGFEFEGIVLTGQPSSDSQGNPPKPGDMWEGPHPGIPYVLTAGGNDIKYTIRPRPNVEKDIKLSKVIGHNKAKDVASPIRDVKGYEGGRFYINEFRTIFAPIRNTQDEWQYVYIGQLNLENWFPESQPDLTEM